MIHESVKSLLAGTKGGAVVLAVLGIALCTSKTIGPILEPFLVGRWEATMDVGSPAGARGARPVSLSLYDDNVVLLDGFKGSWRLIDVSRPTVLIELASQDKGKPNEILELEVQRQEPLQFWGTVRYSGKQLKFKQVNRGGVIGAFEGVIRLEQRAALASAEKVCQQKGWRRKLYALHHYGKHDARIPCDID